MLDWVIKKWDKNKANLEKAIRQDKELNRCEYSYLVKMVVHHILNDGYEIDKNKYYSEDLWDTKKISVIDDGYYGGTQIFLIPKNTCSPGIRDYLFTHQYYGTCGGCDTLIAIQCSDWMSEVPTESQAKDYLLLCQHLVCNMRWLEGERDEEE